MIYATKNNIFIRDFLNGLKAINQFEKWKLCNIEAPLSELCWVYSHIKQKYISYSLISKAYKLDMEKLRQKYSPLLETFLYVENNIST